MAFLISVVSGFGARFHASLVRGASVREFLGLSGYLFVMGIADLVIYSLDRTILGAYKPAATVGLYEGPVRAHNLVRTVNGTLALVVLPSASKYVEEGDHVRVRELLLRGTRYVVALVVPVTVILMALSEPILTVWLGDRFSEAATAMTILMSYWLIASSTAVAAPMLIAAGRARLLTTYGIGVAVLNLCLTLALTPKYGLVGVTHGTAVPYILLQPLLLPAIVREFPVTLRDFARDAWLPAFSLALPLAGILVVLRLTVELDSLLVVLAVMASAFLSYLAAYWALWMTPGERVLLRSFLPGATA
jgi:O-antigen/teichoic acid export membrane protein